MLHGRLYSCDHMQLTPSFEGCAIPVCHLLVVKVCILPLLFPVFSRALVFVDLPSLVACYFSTCQVPFHMPSLGKRQVCCSVSGCLVHTLPCLLSSYGILNRFLKQSLNSCLMAGELRFAQ